MDSQGDNPHKVISAGENERFDWVRWSPDGQRLVYNAVQRNLEEQHWSIETCDLKGENRTVVVPETDLELPDFCWLPDGRIVYSRQESSHSDDGNLWQITVKGRSGVPTGKPGRITQWAGSALWWLNPSADGKRLTFLKRTFQAQVYLGELATGETRMSPPRRLTNDEAFDEPQAWTAESKAVLFNSNRDGAWGIFKQETTQDTAESVVSRSQSRGAAGPRLSADGTWILYEEFPNTSAPASHSPTAETLPARLMRVPANGGVPQFLLDASDLWGYCCARAPASLCVITEESPDQKKFTLTTLDPVKGRGKVLRTIEKDPSVHFGSYDISPDGTTYALSQGSEAEIHIRLLSLSGGSDREVTVKGWPNITGLNWSPDGKGLYVGSVTPQANTLLYVDLKGNARVLWQYKGTGGIWGVPSPDGRYLAILGTATNSNVWMLEGF
jgi:Tol biopolymer transport system component